jgi:sucrose synthase
LAAQRNELISVFACLEAKARQGGTPVLRPHVLVDECARLEAKASSPPAVYRGPDADPGEVADGARASLAAVFRSCTEVLVVLPPGSNGRAALPTCPSDAITASFGHLPSSCAPGGCGACAPSASGGSGSTTTRVALALRPRPGVSNYVYFRGASSVEELSTSQYLALKEKLAADAERADERRRQQQQQADGTTTQTQPPPHPSPRRRPSSLPPLEEDNPFAVLEIDLAPFNKDFPKLRMPGSVGDGVRFLNRYLSAQLFQRPADAFGGVAAPLVLSPPVLPDAAPSSSPTRRALSGAVVGPTFIDSGDFNATAGGFGFGAGGGAGWGVMQGALTQGKVQLFQFLRSLRAPSGESLLVSPQRIDSPGALAAALLRADRHLDDLPDETPYAGVAAARMAALGLERGWGATVGLARDAMRNLLDVLEAPSAESLERFLARLPLVTDVVVLSPHGYFGQDDSVLGRPDTGGQVVYLLDASRGIEAELRRRLAEAGLEDVEPRVVIVTRLIPDAAADTTCAQRLEKITGTESAVILRVPFRTPDGAVLRQWVSRFDVAPYLERYALDVERELLAMLGRPPSLIIGNYTDGGMVATLLEQRMNTIQCHIAHALEVSKYQDADLMWRRYSPRYHFDCVVLSDLIAINNADFVIASSAQEIRGDPREAFLGQYEAMRSLVLPGLCRVVNGVDIFDPKFNVVPPGCDADCYFPFTEPARRLTALKPELEALVYGEETGPHLARGSIGDPERRKLPLLFTMARLDRVKNLASLVEWYGQSPRLQQLCNLVIVGGVVDPSATDDREERSECERMHHLFEAYNLDKRCRWLVAQKARVRNGELYRMVADSRGAFVQPATFEAFGLTVVEAMATGLPTFATKNGGPSEIIRHGVSGFHIDPFHGAACTELIASFFESAARDESVWQKVSQGALKRVQERYTWTHYSRRLLDLTSVYSFWRVVSDLERVETRRYLQSLYVLLLRSRVEAAARAAAERDAAGEEEEKAAA